MAAMREKTSPLDDPLLHEENGELSLHFGFPTIQSRMLRADPAHLLLDYTRTMMGFLLFAPDPARIAMIGLGGGSLAKYCRHRLPDADFTAVELSPAVIALRREFAIPDDDSHFRVVCADGVDFVCATESSLDVLLVDGFDSGGQPHRLCSAAFYDDCRAALAPRGILVVNLCADDSGCGRYIGRISNSFAQSVVVVDADDGDNKIVFAWRDAGFSPTLKSLTNRLVTLEAKHPVDLATTAQKILRREQGAGCRRGRRC